MSNDKPEAQAGDISLLLENFCSSLLEVKDATEDELIHVHARLLGLNTFVRGHQNALQAINRLPPEVLETVFMESRETLSSFMPIMLHTLSYESSLWVSLRLVCRHWHDVIASSTKLWAVIDSARSPGTFIKNSGVEPLIVYWGLHASHSRKSAPIPSCLPMSRVREFHISLLQTQGEYDEIIQSLSSPGPCLESLSIYSDHWHIASQFFNHLPPIFGGQMPRLRKLTLNLFSRWPSTYFRGLTHVCFQYQPEEYRPTTHEFLDFLEGSPNLEVLSLFRAGPTLEEPPINLTQLRIVSLPKLRDFTWAQVTRFFFMKRLMRHLSLPKETQINVSNHDSHIDSAIWDALPQDLTYLPCLTSVKEWRISCWTPTLNELGHIDRGVVLRDGVLYTPCLTSGSQVGAIAQHFGAVVRGVQRLVILDEIALSGDLWKYVFRGLPNLEELAIQPIMLWPTSRNILSALSEDDRGACSSSPLSRVRKAFRRRTVSACPKLISISFYGESMLHAFYLSQLAKARAKRGSPLKRVELRCPCRRIGSACNGMCFFAEDSLILKRHIKEVAYIYLWDPLEVRLGVDATIPSSYTRN